MSPSPGMIGGAPAADHAGRRFEMARLFGHAPEKQARAHAAGEEHGEPGQARELRPLVVAAEADVTARTEGWPAGERDETGAERQPSPARPGEGVAGDAEGGVGHRFGVRTPRAPTGRQPARARAKTRSIRMSRPFLRAPPAGCSGAGRREPAPTHARRSFRCWGAASARTRPSVRGGAGDRPQDPSPVPACRFATGAASRRRGARLERVTMATNGLRRFSAHVPNRSRLGHDPREGGWFVAPFRGFDPVTVPRRGAHVGKAGRDLAPRRGQGPEHDERTRGLAQGAAA